MILKSRFQNASDFDLKSFTKRQIVDWNKYNAFDFELKIFGHVNFWKSVSIQKITFWFNLLRENETFRIFGAVLKAWFWNETFQNGSHFNLKVLQRVRFGIEKNTFSKSYWTCHVILLKKHNTSEFQLKIIQPLRDDLTGGSFQLYIWWINLQQTLSSNSLL